MKSTKCHSYIQWFSHVCLLICLFCLDQYTRNLELINTAFISLLTIHIPKLYLRILSRYVFRLHMDITVMRKRNSLLARERILRTTQKLLLNEALFFRASSMWRFVKVFCPWDYFTYGCLATSKEAQLWPVHNEYHQARAQDGQQPFCLGLKLSLIPLVKKY